MRLRRAAAGGAVLAVAVGAAVALAPPRAMPDARYARADCRIAAPEAPDGAALTGIEDLALLPDGALLASAHDRLGDGPAGLFVIDPNRPDGPARAVAGLPADARPHGVALSEDGGRLAFVNRVPGGAEIRSGAFDGIGFAEERRLAGDAFCRANDLAFADGALLVTLDRADCGPSLRDLAPGARTGRILLVDAEGASEEALSGLSFPNGVAFADGALAAAETRAARLRLGDAAIGLPGGPDNLTALPDGRLLAALHPSLPRLALRRAGLPIAAPTRIVAVSRGGAVEPLFDDPEGALMSGASVAVLVGGALIAGAPFDDGLLICGEIT